MVSDSLLKPPSQWVSLRSGGETGSPPKGTRASSSGPGVCTSRSLQDSALPSAEERGATQALKHQSQETLTWPPPPGGRCHSKRVKLGRQGRVSGPSGGGARLLRPCGPETSLLRDGVPPGTPREPALSGLCPDPTGAGQGGLGCLEKAPWPQRFFPYPG